MSVLEASTASQLQTWAEDLLANVNASLATTGGGAISRAFVSPGLPVLDCCPQLTVDVRGMGHDSTVPQNPITMIGHRAAHQSLILATYVVTIARCIGWEDGTVAVDPVLQQEVANVINQDLFAAWNGIEAALRNGEIFSAPCMAVYMDPAVPLTPAGGCVGWLLQLRPAVSGYVPGS